MNKLTFEEYLPLAIRTLPAFHFEKQVRHCTTGFITELGELLDCFKKHFYYNQPLNVENVEEEIGDAFWYIACLLSTTKFPEDKLKSMSEAIEGFSPLIVSSEELEPDDFALSLVRLALDDDTPSEGITCLCTLAHLYCTKTVGEILYANIEKLKKRYPEGYSDFNAQARLDKTNE